MTPNQLTTFKTAILANAALASARAAGDHGAITAHYNANNGGAIWRPDLSTAELNTAIVWSEFAALTTGLQNTYLAVIAPGTVDATSANVRGAFTTVFAANTVSLANLVTLAQRQPTRFEALFTTAQVSTMYGQSVSVADVTAALGV